MVIIAESIGSLALIAGLLTRFAAASVMLIMLGAIAMGHWPKGFVGQQQGEGFEYHLLVDGDECRTPGRGRLKWAVDSLIARWLTHRGEPPPARLRQAA